MNTNFLCGFMFGLLLATPSLCVAHPTWVKYLIASGFVLTTAIIVLMYMEAFHRCACGKIRCKSHRGIG